MVASPIKYLFDKIGWVESNEEVIEKSQNGSNVARSVLLKLEMW